MKNKYLDMILKFVSEETELDEAAIVGCCKSEECVNARVLFCWFAYKAVASKKIIASYLKTDAVRIAYLLNTFEEKKKINIFRLYYEKIKIKLLQFHNETLKDIQ